MKIQRFFLCVLIFTLAFTSISAVRAHASGAGGTGNANGERAAAICRDVGLLRGGENGVDEAYLSEYATRLQAMYLSVRLIGKETVATSYIWTSNFADANTVENESGRNLLAYIKAHPEFGWHGDYAGNIDPSGYLTSQAMYKVLLSLLGYTADVDYKWEATNIFAESIGLRAMTGKRGFLTNGDISVMLVEALKTRVKDSQKTLCEYLVIIGVVNENAAYAVSLLPGSPGFKPQLTYANGGPLLVEIILAADQKKVSIRYNAALNPTYAKSIKNYNYFLPGSGYTPLPAQCQTGMLDEYTVFIQFPGEGWVAYDDAKEADAFFTYIASQRLNELRVRGLYDVDGTKLPDLYIDVPTANKINANSLKTYDADGPGPSAGGGESTARKQKKYLR